MDIVNVSVAPLMVLSIQRFDFAFMVRRFLSITARRFTVLSLIVTGLGILPAPRSVAQSGPEWRLLGDVNAPRERHENSYVAVNGRFYLVGGRGTRKITRYDPADSTWIEGPHTPDQISLHHFQAAAIGDTIYIVGAYTATFPEEIAVENVYKYDTASWQWVTGPSIPVTYRRGSAGVAVYNNKLYVVGGSVGGHANTAVRLTRFDEYDPFTDSWTALPDLPNARDHVNVSVVGNKLYVAGGRNGSNNSNVEEVDIYNFNTGSWSTLPSPAGDIPTPRAGAASVAVGNFVVVIGGESTQDLAHNETEALNTLTNTWTTLDPLVVGRHGTQAVVHNGDIYIASGAGEKGGGPELDSHEIMEVDGALPVELSPDLRAVAIEQSILLSWRTLSETNNAGFEVQRLVEEHFESVGFVEGMGTRVEPQDYHFTVESLPAGRHVFRLKQIDFDGAFQYSPEFSAVISVEGAFQLGAIYPNPFNPQARFSLTLTREQHVSIEVYDVLGRSVQVLHDGILRSLEPYTFTIDSYGWAGGKYILRAEGDYFTASRTFTVLK